MAHCKWERQIQRLAMLMFSNVIKMSIKFSEVCKCHICTCSVFYKQQLIDFP